MFFFLQFLLYTLINILEAKSSNRQQINLIEKHMDMTVSPCDDYYRYACGNWRQYNSNLNYNNTLGYIDHKTVEDFKQHFSNVRPNKRISSPKFIQNIYNYYQSCHLLSDYDQNHYLKWLKMFEHLEWPTPLPRKYMQSKRKKYNWQQMLAIIRKYGLTGIFITETIIIDDQNNTILLLIDMPAEDQFRRFDIKGFEIILTYLTMKPMNRRTQLLWQEFQEFEELIVYIRNNVSSEPQSLRKLQMPWLREYLTIITNDDVDLDKLEITVHNPLYFQILFIFLENTYTSEFICRYLMIRFLWHLYESGPKSFLQYDCVVHVRMYLPLASQWLYQKNHPQLADDIADIENIFKHLVDKYREMLDGNIHFFNKKILKFLHKKLNALRISFDNLPKGVKSQQLDTFYSDLNLDGSDFYANHLKILHFNVNNEFRLMKIEFQTNDIYKHLHEIDDEASASPYYLPTSNLIIVPTISLRKPIYDRDLDDLFKYSGFGFLLAHEIMHTFDHDSLNYDWKGEMRGPIKIISANKLYDKNLNCIRKINPDTTDEKIADLSGFSWAYRAYFNDSRNEIRLNWLKYSAEELFLLNFSQFFCGDSLDADILHGTEKSRVNDIMKNFIDFPNIYKCAKGSPMNPLARCQLWR